MIPVSEGQDISRFATFLSKSDWMFIQLQAYLGREKSGSQESRDRETRTRIPKHTFQVDIFILLTRGQNHDMNSILHLHTQDYLKLLALLDQSMHGECHTQS